MNFICTIVYWNIILPVELPGFSVFQLGYCFPFISTINQPILNIFQIAFLFSDLGGGYNGMIQNRWKTLLGLFFIGNFLSYEFFRLWISLVSFLVSNGILDSEPIHIHEIMIYILGIMFLEMVQKKSLLIQWNFHNLYFTIFCFVVSAIVFNMKSQNSLCDSKYWYFF